MNEKESTCSNKQEEKLIFFLIKKSVGISQIRIAKHNIFSIKKRFFRLESYFMRHSVTKEKKNDEGRAKALMMQRSLNTQKGN